MSKFKAGDLVVPIKDKCRDLNCNYRVYTVVKAYRDQVDLDSEFEKGRTPIGWWEERFELDKNHIVINILNDI